MERRHQHAASLLGALRSVLRLATVAATLGLPSACQSPQPGSPSTAEANMKIVTIPIEGMSCASCTARVKKALTAIEGVGEVEVNLGKRNARIQYDPAKVAPDRLGAVITDLGYTVGEPEPR